jgi:hypothetical protein
MEKIKITQENVQTMLHLINDVVSKSFLLMRKARNF